MLRECLWKSLCPLLLAALLGGPFVPGAWAASANVPLDSWVYPALDKLTGLGLIQSSLQGMRPYTREETVRQVLEARAAAADRVLPVAAGELLRRLEREFAVEVAAAAARRERPAHLTLTSGDLVRDEAGRFHVPHRLTNTDNKKGRFRLRALIRPDGAGLEAPAIYADRNDDGVADDLLPVTDPVLLEAGEVFPFLVRVPPSDGAEAGEITVRVAASEERDTNSREWLTPCREIRLDYVYRDGDKSSYPGTNARQFPLDYNNFGINYGEGHNLRLSFQSEVNVGSLFHLSVRPFLLYDEEDDDLHLRLLEGKAALGLGHFEVSAGRQALWWGQGRHGSLILTNNAQPLDMVRVNTARPLRLPALFGFQGAFGFDLFWSRLEDNRAVPEPYMAGLRLTLKPLPWLEVGASRTVLFGGEGRPGVDFDEFFTILGGKNPKSGEDNQNSVAAIDARLRLPFLWNAELYGELGGEDEAGMWIAKKAYLAGLYLPRLEPTGRLSLRIEHADLNFEGNGPVWYRHGTYRSGYTYEGNLLGHHAGGDARDTFVEMEVLCPRDLTLALSVDIEKRGYSQPAVEKHIQPGIRAEWQVKDSMRLDLLYRYDRIENFGNEQGRDRDAHLAAASISYTW
ncbi:MAG: capsule assembly Wzi family protein [Deltaproteobacteria bacterium]|nr:capsule assembly Wzi family protein [Deltaproteobacteria bacterium]